jgi:HD-like signal output (HDOD) protein
MISTPDQQSDLDRELEASLREIGIPPRPVILELVIREVRKDTPDTHFLAELVSRDVALAAGVIKTANSPFYGSRQKIRSIREALLVLGTRTTANTIAGLVLRRVFPDQLHLERFWGASERTAQLAGWLAQQVGVRFGVMAEDAYTYGLFRDCGIPIMMRRFDQYPRVLALANVDAVHDFTEVEQAAVPTNHALLGGLMAQSWWLPEMTCIAIRQHHDIRTLNANPVCLPGASFRLIALAQLAERLIQINTGLNRTREWDKLGAACLGCLDLDDLGLVNLADEARNFIDSLTPI